MTFDAGLVPYERDFTIAVQFSLFTGFALTCKGTENMVRSVDFSPARAA
jgi:hypothetical protein